jgi:hypothetical protein
LLEILRKPAAGTLIEAALFGGVLKIDADIVAIVIRSRGASTPTGVQAEDPSEGDHPEGKGPSGLSD